jgi:hypothetical protein
MPHAIIRGKSGRRHEVDFESCALRVEVHASDETFEIFVEADTNQLPQERRWFALINIPRHLFSQATAEAAKRKNEMRGFGSEPVPDRRHP